VQPRSTLSLVVRWRLRGDWCHVFGRPRALSYANPGITS